MKKIFSLAIALIATIGIANAQEKSYTMLVTDIRGDVLKYSTESVEDVTFEESEWETLGTGTFTDYFYFDYNPYDVEIQRNVNDSKEYRLVDPYLPGLLAEEYISSESDYKGDHYLTFRIMSSGEKLDGTTLRNGIVYYDPYCPGWYYNYYGDYVWLYHPSYFYGYESYWTNNKVVSYQDDGETPAEVQFAPMYYMPNYGGYWSCYDAAYVVITFPNAPAGAPQKKGDVVTIKNASAPTAINKVAK